jgi:hypothetical protein
MVDTLTEKQFPITIPMTIVDPPLLDFIPMSLGCPLVMTNMAMENGPFIIIYRWFTY